MDGHGPPLYAVQGVAEDDITQATIIPLTIPGRGQAAATIY